MFDFLNYEWHLTVLLLIGCVCAVWIIQIILQAVCLCFFNKNKQNKTNPLSSDAVGVSVVVVTNNNAEALKNSLLQILEQDYPLFEVVVVNENSTDDTEFVLYVLKNNYPNLTVINLGKNDNKFESHKFSLSIGIRSAKYPYCLLTDVGCTPKNFDWLQSIMTPINADRNKKIVTGIVIREKSESPFLNTLCKWDEIVRYNNLISFTNMGNAYSSCGMNMIYNKDFFIANGGLINQYQLNCLQEDYFVNKHSDKNNTSCVADKDARLYLPAIENFSAFVRLKFATALSHKVRRLQDKILLSVNPVISFLIYALLGLLLFFGLPWQYILIFIVIKWIAAIIIAKKQSANLDIKKIFWFAPLLEIFFAFFSLFISIRVLFYRKKEKKIRWKKK